jgi:hypothetical protein
MGRMFAVTPEPRGPKKLGVSNEPDQIGACRRPCSGLSWLGPRPEGLGASGQANEI